VGNQKINGVPISSLISQYAGGSNVTIPQVTYEDLGVTLKATPTIQKAGRVSLKLDLKIEALSGTSSNGNPLLASRQLSSEIVVAEGESVLLVSNVSQTEAAAMSGIPGLSELPGFQAPVADDVQKTTDRLVLVVTPHVVRRRSNLLASPRILLRGEGESSN
jgi:Flp pilus assembly secretin CpaC